MRKTSLNEISTWCQGSVTKDAEITGIKVDSRVIETGDMYVCLQGQKVDGHDFVQAALDKGAVALLCDHKLDIDAPQIIVDDTLTALFEIGKTYRDSLEATFIGITGSNGKTSSKDMLNAILSQVGGTIATHKNQNTEIGTCLNLFRMDDETKFAVMEVGLDLPGEVFRMSKIIRPDAAIVTSLGAMHMKSFKSTQEIADEKLALFDWTKNKALCFYQGDFKEYRDRLDYGHRFGFGEDNEFVVSDVVLSNDGVTFRVNQEAYSCNLLGRHQASNACGVIALSRALGINDETIRYGLNHVALTSLRTEVYKHHKSLILMDAYKSNPASAKSALEILENYEFSGSKIAILGDMLELGDSSLKEHIMILDECERRNIHQVISFGDIFKEASLSSIIAPERLKTYNNFNELFKDVQALYETESLILIKGSRSLQLERLVVKGD